MRRLVALLSALECNLKRERINSFLPLPLASAQQAKVAKGQLNDGQ